MRRKFPALLALASLALWALSSLSTAVNPAAAQPAPPTPTEKSAETPPETPDAGPKTEAPDGAPATPASVVTEPSGPTPAEQRAAARKEKAAQFYVEAQKLYGDELYLAALRAYEKSYSFFKTPVTIYNIAKCNEKLGKAAPCIASYEQYVKAYRKAKKTEPPDIVDIKNAMAKCRLGLRLEITIDSDPAGSSVYLNNAKKLIGQTPMKTTLDPGNYVLFVKSKGRVDLKREIVVRQGEPQKYFFTLETIRRAGRVKIESNVAGASIFVDGQNVGRTPFDGELVLKEGEHQILVEKSDYVRVNQTLDVRTDQSYVVDASLWLKSPPGTWKDPVGWASLIIGSILIAGGYGTGYYAETLFSGSPEFNEFATYQEIGYGAGGGLAGVGLILLIWEAVGDRAIRAEDAISSRESPRGLTFQPLVRVQGDAGIFGADFRF